MSLSQDSNCHSWRTFLMHNALRFSTMVGGCYMVSVGTTTTIDAENSMIPRVGLAALEKHLEPINCCSWRSSSLRSRLFSLQANHSFSLCLKWKIVLRFWILQWNHWKNFDDQDVINKFREGEVRISHNRASYYPFLNTTLIKASEIDYTKNENLDGLIEVLSKNLLII